MVNTARAIFTTKALALVTALILVSCGKATPEDAAAEVGDKKCECDKLKHDSEYGMSYADATRAIIEIMENNDTLLIQEAWEQFREAENEGVSEEEQERRQKKDEQRYKECIKELKALTNDIVLNFPRKEDQEVVETVFEAKGRICEQVREDEKEELKEPLEQLEKRRRAEQRRREKSAANPAQEIMDRAFAEAEKAAQEAEAAAMAEAQRQRQYTVDVAKSTVKWTGTMLGVKSHNGTIDLSKGRITTQNDRVIGGSFTVDMKSITPLDNNYAGDGEKQGTKSMFVAHLNSADFFDVVNFPLTTFMITGVEGSNVRGLLTVRGRSHEETVTGVSLTEFNGTVQVTGKLIFNRQKFGVAWQAPMKDVVLNDAIELNIDLHGHQL